MRMSVHVGSALQATCLAASHVWAADPSPAPAAAQPAVPSIPIKVPAGFMVESIYRVAADQGSWVSMAVDPRGRLIASDQFGKLYRVRVTDKVRAPVEVEPLKLDLGSTQGLLWAFDSLYGVVNRPLDAGGSGLYRARDTDGDDQFDQVTCLRPLEGSGEHGPHAILLGPDGKSLYLLAGNATPLPELEKSRVPRNWRLDSLIPPLGQTDGVWRTNRPGGWIAKLDPDGRTFELICVGLRNPYDMAFNADGDLFAFDADMEWDLGTPWYRPTRVNHLTSGAEFGWRTGSAKWPDYYPDSQPAVLDVGESSPTGMAFGYGAKFPARYQRALFMGDWSYGKIFALHLGPDGASYTATNELFLAGSPLPITDLVIRPQDGALYFITGGRHTSSSLYRVTYRGPEPTAPVRYTVAAGGQARAERRGLESFHGAPHPTAVPAAWPHLRSRDRALRYAARIAIEHQPVTAWRDRAFREADPRARMAGLMALVRCASPDCGPQVIAALAELPWPQLNRDDQLELVRVYSLVGTRFGKPTAPDRERILRQLDGRFPAGSYELNKELAQLLVFLDAPGIVDRLLTAMERAPSQEEPLHHALCLRTLDPGAWTPAQRERYFGWFARSLAAGGGVTYGDYLLGIRGEVANKLTPAHQQALADVLAQNPPADPYLDLRQRQVVREWRVEDLLPAAAAGMRGRDFDQGRRVFSTAMCIKCHRFNRQGGMAGPDLTGVGNRFDDRALLEAMLDPSKVVSDQYATVEVNTKDGDSYTGRIGDQNENEILLKADMLNPANIRKIPWSDIESVRPSRLSLMPMNLLDSFAQDEILDLLAYLKSQGNPAAELFRK
jgi:putative heme-binding domain-containing protein